MLRGCTVEKENEGEYVLREREKERKKKREKECGVCPVFGQFILIVFRFLVIMMLKLLPGFL